MSQILQKNSLLSNMVLFCAVCAFFNSPYIHAEEALTPSAGVLSVHLPPKADTVISIPFHRPPVYRGKVALGSSIQEVKFQGNPGWDVNEFNYNELDQHNHYYALVMSGVHAGEEYPLEVSDFVNTSNSVFVTGLSEPLAKNTIVEIIPYWTLESAFTSGIVGTYKSSINNSLSAGLRVYFKSAECGINTSNTEPYYYYEGNLDGGSGWRQNNDGSDAIANDDIIYPGEYITIRNVLDHPLVLQLFGHNQKTGFKINMTNSDTGVHDHYLGFKASLASSLRESCLLESGAMEPTIDPYGIGADKLYVYHSEESGFNKSSDECYYYYEGDFCGGPGWRKFPNATVKVDDEIILRPGQGFYIRKQQPASDSASVWNYVPKRNDDSNESLSQN